MAGPTKAELEKRAKELDLTVTKRDGTEGEPTIADYQYAIGVAEGALMPDEPAVTTESKTFTVTGPFAVLGTGPGESFAAEVAEDGTATVDGVALNVQALLEQGAIAEAGEEGERG